jgi:hypothetical protein
LKQVTRLVSGGAFAVITLLASAALAQDPYGPGLSPGFGPSPGQGGGSSKKAPAKPPDGMPETHAASGGDDSLEAPGNEPTIPSDPLAIKKSSYARIGSDLSPELEERGQNGRFDRKFYGPYYSERSGDYTFKLAFPVWAERTQPSRNDKLKLDRASLFGGLYYNRRSAERADDVLFPVVWNLRDLEHKTRTTVIGPLVNRVTPEGHDNWLAPLYFTGKRKDGGGYTLIPPLLTYTQTDGRSGLNLVGPLFCSWKGSSSCDARTAEDIDLGVAPLYFYGQNAERKYEIIPPLLHYYRYNDRDLSWFNVWGPYYREHTQKREMFHLLPLYYSIWGKNERHTTVFPFFHYGHKDNEFLLANPLFLLARGEKNESTFATWGYARYRGRTELDMITPLYWAFRDPDIGLDQKLLFPFFYKRTSPRESSWAFFPFYGKFERFGISKSTWITPFFQHSTDLRGWSTNIHPLVYLGRDGQATHTVLAPFFWDFAEPKQRATVAFPFYWRFSDRKSVSQLVGNVYYREEIKSTGSEWEVHIFPAFSYGETPRGHWWNILYGLAGYTREGATTKMRTMWIPITLSEGPK